jgi:hypothetical protein
MKELIRNSELRLNDYKKQFCEHNSLSFENTREDLLDIFSDSVKLNFW